MHGTYQHVREGDAPALPVRLSQRVLIRNWLLALAWPFLAAVLHVKHFPRYRMLAGFVLFCGFAGFVLVPMVGSDAHSYMLRYEAFRVGQDLRVSEPVPAALMTVLAWLDLNVRWYFALLGLLYGAFVAWAAKILFRNVPRNVTLGLAAMVFVAAFFLNHPVFSAVNARYHLGLWVLVASTLLTLEGRWKQALAVAAFGTMIHFGHVLFSLALVVLLLSRMLGPWQIFFAYTMLAIAVVLPSWVFVGAGGWLTQIMGDGALSDKIAAQVGYAEHRLEFGSVTGQSGGPWFLAWFTTPIFWSLMITGHFLAWKLIKKRSDPLFQLWILIILMWALQFAMAGVPEGTGRVQRNTTALLLLWHARWFLLRKDGARMALAVNVLPMLFYFAVAYRRWLHQAGVGAFLPTPFGVWPDLWPTVMELLGFG